jgi:modulator of FtsH protease
VTLYSTDGWSDFLVAGAAAAGTLAGLVFVAISINLTRILDIASMPGRAAETLILLLNVLLLCLVTLAPGESRTTLGLLVLLLGLAGWAAVVRIQLRSPMPPDYRSFMVRRVAFSQAATLPFVAAGVSILAGGGGGMAWFLGGVLIGLAVSVGNAWVLLIEILR